jgi:hypothetical protein
MDITLSSWHSYGKVWALGHPKVKNIFQGWVVVEEKLDGSQWSWGVHNGELKLKTHTKERHYPVDDKLFKAAADKVWDLFQQGLLVEGYTYRSECITRPKHNCLAYDRCPDGYMVLFDVETSQGQFLGPDEKHKEALRLGIEPVIAFYRGDGKLLTEDTLKGYLENISLLGGQKIEGVVVKNYSQFIEDGKVMMGKYVSEKFKEVQKSDWKKSNPGQGDIIMELIEQYRSEARWNKAVQHLKEDGECESDPRDIGKLVRLVCKDVHEECQEEIKEKLFKWAWKKINNGLTKGMPEWYKQQLLEQQFSEDETNELVSPEVSGCEQSGKEDCS